MFAHSWITRSRKKTVLPRLYVALLNFKRRMDTECKQKENIVQVIFLLF